MLASAAAWALANVKVFYVMGKALSGELSCPCDRSCSTWNFLKAAVAEHWHQHAVLLLMKKIYGAFTFCRANYSTLDTRVLEHLKKSLLAHKAQKAIMKVCHTRVS